jgi:hypothetical protein
MFSNRPVTIYISAAPELMAEREALAQMIAKLPVTLAWHIVQTPREGELVDREALQIASLFFLIMGSDIRAPIGSEWYLAQQTRRQTLPFLKQGVVRTPAGQIFVRDIQIPWLPFASVAQLSRQAQQLLIDHLLLHAVEYALTPAEIAELEKRLTTAIPTEPEAAKGAGHSAILISRERYMPAEGVILDEGF